MVKDLSVSSKIPTPSRKVLVEGTRLIRDPCAHSVVVDLHGTTTYRQSFS